MFRHNPLRHPNCFDFIFKHGFHEGTPRAGMRQRRGNLHPHSPVPGGCEFRRRSRTAVRQWGASLVGVGGRLSRSGWTVSVVGVGACRLAVLHYLVSRVQENNENHSTVARPDPIRYYFSKRRNAFDQGCCNQNCNKIVVCCLFLAAYLVCPSL